MPLPNYGHVQIGGILFPVDPGTYEPANWPKRMTVHRLIRTNNGQLGTVTQDFGRALGDRRIRLGSAGPNSAGGGEQYLDESTKGNLDSLAGQRGATFTLSDWVGNNLTVVILSFVPSPTFIPDEPGPPPTGALWRYEMECQVIG